MIRSILSLVNCSIFNSKSRRLLKCGEYFRLDAMIFPPQNSLYFSTVTPSTNIMTTALTLKIDIFHPPSSVGFTYTGSFDFLYYQASFDNIFDSNSVMLLITHHSFRVIAEFYNLRLKILDLCSLSQFHIFLEIIQLQYIETTRYNYN